MSDLPKARTRRITLGSVPVGGGAPVSVQTMCNTDTRDVAATASQIRSASSLGADIVRLAVPDMEAAEAISKIKKEVPSVPLVADIHFDWRLAIASIEAGVDGLRINPGNIGERERVRAVVRAASQREIPIRVGVNAGSLEKHILAKYGHASPEALVESAMGHVRMLEDEGFGRIKISVKASDVQRTVAAYRLLSQKTDWPLHLGVTEAGTFLAGTVRSSVAMGVLLSEGIGDTIRVSLTDTPEEEVRVGLELLRALSLRPAGPSVTSCPTCGRTKVDLIGTARDVERSLDLYYRSNPSSARVRVAVMGCVVNGPGEAKDADIGLMGGDGNFVLFLKGRRIGLVERSEAPVRVVELVRQINGEGD